MATWRCPHCATLQVEASACFLCHRSATSCGTCVNFRRSLVGGVGYCALDRRREPLTGAEQRSCWTAAARPAGEGLLDGLPGLTASSAPRAPERADASGSPASPPVPPPAPAAASRQAPAAGRVAARRVRGLIELELARPAQPVTGGPSAEADVSGT